MKRTASITDIFRPLAEVQTQVKLTNALQVADILEWILGQVGEAEVWQTSFSISEEFLRRLFFIQKKHRVTAFHLVLDYKATQKTINLWTFIRQVMKDTFLSTNHSKVLLVKASAGTVVAVVTSQNLTRGNRSESYMVTTDPSVFAQFEEDLQDLIRNHSVPFADIYSHAETKPDAKPSDEKIVS